MDSGSDRSVVRVERGRAVLLVVLERVVVDCLARREMMAAFVGRISSYRAIPAVVHGPA